MAFKNQGKAKALTVFAVSLLILSVFTILPIQIVKSETLFNEGFENWNVYGWTNSTAAASSLSVDSASAINGTYGMNSTVVGNNQYAYIQRINGINTYQEFSFLVNPSTLNVYAYGVNFRTTIIRLANSSSNINNVLDVGIMRNATGHFWCMVYWNNTASATSNVSAGVPVQGQTYNVSGQCLVGVNGFVSFSINDVLMANVTVDNSQRNNLYYTVFGIVSGNNNAGVTQNYLFDEFTSKNQEADPTPPLSGYLLTEDWEYANESLYEPENWRYYYYNTTANPANITDVWAYHGTHSLEIMSSTNGYCYRAKDFLNINPSNATYTHFVSHCSVLNTVGASAWQQGIGVEGRTGLYGVNLFFAVIANTTDNGATWWIYLAHFNGTTGAHLFDHSFNTTVQFKQGDTYCCYVSDVANGTYRIQSISINGTNYGTLETEDLEQFIYQNIYAGVPKASGLMGTTSRIEVDAVSISYTDNATNPYAPVIGTNYTLDLSMATAISYTTAMQWQAKQALTVQTAMSYTTAQQWNAKNPLSLSTAETYTLTSQTAYTLALPFTQSFTWTLDVLHIIGEGIAYIVNLAWNTPQTWTLLTQTNYGLMLPFTQGFTWLFSSQVACNLALTWATGQTFTLGIIQGLGYVVDLAWQTGLSWLVDFLSTPLGALDVLGVAAFALIIALTALGIGALVMLKRRDTD